ncbi:MAG: glycosyltransferase family 2 protein [Candidatus Korarchaeota archaeon]|nr:glycosyltransferase family 2 protein [Candidatus Korarchaeota archaeon]NIU83915.1 glycosyltransferase [Candidatus Thorarchaeota archaeon]NIW14205.1 glycosyltransferase [Candidatus Thorarchaeota archaeon]NIW52304.1 glycosyltransferase [Candidatus Korarchaeota archaeon]
MNELSAQEIEYVREFSDNLGEPKASVIIVTYNIPKTEFKPTLDALEHQTTKNFEILIIDNGNDWDIDVFVSTYSQVRVYVKLKKNYGLNEARNIGAKLAKGNILIFLDDDGIPRRDFVREHLKAHSDYDIVAASGKIIPKTRTFYSKLNLSYDLGEKVIPYIINTEGNSSFNREKFLEVSGFEEKLRGSGGGEGLLISYKLIKNTSDKSKIIYYPKAVIYHDPVSGFIPYINKQIKHRKYKKMFWKTYPEIVDLIKYYKKTRFEKARREMTLSEKLLRLVVLFFAKVL